MLYISFFAVFLCSKTINKQNTKKKLHNFEFGDGELNVVWRAYGIVSGKRFVVDKNTGQSLYVCYFMILER